MNLTTCQPPDQPTQPLSVAPEPQYETCEGCAAPVDKEQRYCVVCGTRRKHVYDPAARFLAGATGRNRGRSGPARLSQAAARPRRFQSVGTALAIAIIPVAIGIGVVLGKSGSGSDQQLLDAIRSQKPPVVNVGGGGGRAVASTGTSHTSGTGTGKAKGKGKSAKSAGSSSTGSKKVLATTSNGTFTSLTNTKPPSQSQLNQNAQIVKKVQSTISTHYVQSQKNLPNSIAVP